MGRSAIRLEARRAPPSRTPLREDTDYWGTWNSAVVCVNLHVAAPHAAGMIIRKHLLMAMKLTITTDGSTLTVTDGCNSRTVNFATTRGAKSLAARLDTNPDLARQWMMSAVKYYLSVRPTFASICRIDHVITIYADTGKAIRTCICPTVQDAIVLESKLISDIDFAIWWVMGQRYRTNNSQTNNN